MRRVITLILAIWVLLLANVLGLLKTPEGIAVSLSMFILVLGEGLIYYKHERGAPVPYSLSYISYIILIFIGYSFKIIPLQPWTGQFLVFSALTSIIIAVWNVINKLNDKELLPQLFVMYGLLASLYGIDIKLALGITAVSVALVRNFKSYFGLLLTLVFLPGPIIGLPGLVANIYNVPHITIAGVNPASVQYSSIVIVLYIMSVVLAAITGSLSMLIWKKRRVPSSVADVIKESLVHAVFPIIFLAAGIFTEHFILGITDLKSYALPVLISTVMSLGAVGCENALILREKKTKLEEILSERLQKLRAKLDRIKEAMAILRDYEIGIKNLEKASMKIHQVETVLNHAEKELMSHKVDYKTLISIKKDLDNAAAIIREADKNLIEAYRDAVSLIQKSYPLITLFEQKEPIKSEELRILAKAESSDDIIIRFDLLLESGKKICEALAETVNDSLSYFNKLLGTNYSIDPESCKKWKSPFRSIGTVLGFLSQVTQENEKEILDLYSKLIGIKQSVEDIIPRISMDELRNSLFLRELLALENELRGLPEVPPSPYVAVKIIIEKAEFLRDTMRNLTKAAEKDLAKIRADVAKYIIKGAKGIELAIDSIEDRLRKATQDELVSTEKHVRDLVTELSIKLPRMIRDLTNIITDAIELRDKAPLIPLIFDYLNWELKQGNGRVRLEDLPFTDKTLIWFIKMYVMTKENITVEYGQLRLVGGDQR